MFKLKRPCENCPFKKGVGQTFRLEADRLVEIINQTAFQCHKTVDYTKSWLGQPGQKPQQCAGLMALLHRVQRPSTIMQVGERLGHLDLDALDPGHEAYSSLRAMFKAHGHKLPRKISKWEEL